MKYRFFFSILPLLVGVPVFTLLALSTPVTDWRYYAILAVVFFLWMLISTQFVKVSKTKISLIRYWVFYYTIEFDDFSIEANVLKMFLNKKEIAKVSFEETFDVDIITFEKNGIVSAEFTQNADQIFYFIKKSLKQ